MIEAANTFLGSKQQSETRNILPKKKSTKFNRWTVTEVTRGEGADGVDGSTWLLWLCAVFIRGPAGSGAQPALDLLERPSFV